MTSEKLIQIAENEPKVYEAGKADGVEQGFEQGLSEVSHLNDELEQILYGTDTGGKSFYDEFWDSVQQNGERRNYAYAFSNSGKPWNSQTFKPKYDIICEESADNCFYAWEDRTDSFDLGAYLKSHGLKLDTSKATSMKNFISYAYSFIGELPIISFESAGAYTTGAIRGIMVSKIDKIIVTEQTIFNDWFRSSGELIDVVFEGRIATGNLNMSGCTKLSKASIYSVVNALSTTTSGLTVTLSKTAVTSAFGSTTSEEWLNLVATRSNWTIALA
jgi:hypothetical protein